MRQRGTRHNRRRLVVIAAAVAALGSACSSNTSVSQPTTPAPATSTPSTSPSPSPPPPCADRVLARMSLSQRVGQLFFLGLAHDQLGPAEVDAIRSDHFGSVTFIETTTEGVDGVRAVTDAVKAQVSKEATRGVGFFIAANQEGGEIQALRGAGFSTIPSAAQQGAMDPATLRSDAGAWGRELAAAGVNMNFAPVLDVLPPGSDSQNQPIGVLHRGYGHDPDTVTAHAFAFMKGMRAAGVAPVGKHFPGLGRVRGNTDFVSNVVDDVTTATDPYLDSFRQAVHRRLPFVMVALATYTRIDPHHLAVFSPTIMRLLRNDLGFHGVIVSDDMGAATAVANVPADQRGVEFISAGGDMIISKTLAPAEAMDEGVLARAGSDPAFRARVDAAALAVLEAKDTFGLLPCSG